MKVAELKKILEKTDDDADVLIEYMPRAHESEIFRKILE